MPAADPASGAGGVTAHLHCQAAFQGYPDRLHGGIVATLLDAALTHCLFAWHIRGYTGKLRLRFHSPVALGVTAYISARLIDARPPLYLLSVRLFQGGPTRASTEATFWGESPGKSCAIDPWWAERSAGQDQFPASRCS